MDKEKREIRFMISKDIYDKLKKEAEELDIKKFLVLVQD